MNSVKQLLWGAIAVSLVGGLGFPTNAATSIGQQPNAERQSETKLAQGYYDSCPRAETVRVYETRNFWVSICKGSDDNLFYRGVNKRNRDSAINLNDVVVVSTSAYRVRNANTIYDISPKTLVVTQNGKVILREPVIKFR